MPGWMWTTNVPWASLRGPRVQREGGQILAVLLGREMGRHPRKASFQDEVFWGAMREHGEGYLKPAWGQKWASLSWRLSRWGWGDGGCRRRVVQIAADAPSLVPMRAQRWELWASVQSMSLQLHSYSSSSEWGQALTISDLKYCRGLLAGMLP